MFCDVLKHIISSLGPVVKHQMWTSRPRAEGRLLQVPHK